MAKRRWRLMLTAVVLPVVAALGWWAWAGDDLPGLTDPDELALYSIDGRHRQPEEPPAAGETFHGYPVYGAVALTDPAARRAVASAVRAGLVEPDISAAACFWPRHGVRVTAGGRTTDYVICFECHQARIYAGGRRKARLTGRTPQAVLDRYLAEAGVPLAPSPFDAGQQPAEPAAAADPAAR